MSKDAPINVFGDFELPKPDDDRWAKDERGRYVLGEIMCRDTWNPDTEEYYVEILGNPLRVVIAPPTSTLRREKQYVAAVAAAWKAKQASRVLSYLKSLSQESK